MAIENDAAMTQWGAREHDQGAHGGPLQPVRLIGEYVRLEPLRLDHLEDLFNAAGADEEVWCWLPQATPGTPDELATYLAEKIAEMDRGERLAFAVVHLDTGRAVGSTSLYRFNSEDHSISTGWTWYGRAFWRTAVNTETRLLVLTHAFEYLGARRINWRVDSCNERNRKALLRIGAHEDRVVSSDRLWNGSLRDGVYFSMHSHEWYGSAKTNIQQLLARWEMTAKARCKTITLPNS